MNYFLNKITCMKFLLSLAGWEKKKGKGEEKDERESDMKGAIEAKGEQAMERD